MDQASSVAASQADWVFLAVRVWIWRAGLLSRPVWQRPQLALLVAQVAFGRAQLFEAAWQALGFVQPLWVVAWALDLQLWPGPGFAGVEVEQPLWAELLGLDCQLWVLARCFVPF